MNVRSTMTETEYKDALFDFMKLREGDVTRIYSDPDGVPTLGMG